jgi:two-component system response regulator NreC
MSIRILLADDHTIARQSLRAILEDHGLQVIAEAADGHEAARLCEKLSPDVAVLDVSMPLLNGVDAAREIAKTRPRTKIIHLTMHMEDEFVLNSLRAGATGYVSKEIAADELVNAIETVANGGIYVSSAASQAVLRLLHQQKTEDEGPLCGRERQVLQLLAEGKSMRQIGAVLGISSRTAQSHRAKIMAKLGVQDVPALVRYAIEIGLVPRHDQPVATQPPVRLLSLRRRDS